MKIQTQRTKKNESTILNKTEKISVYKRDLHMDYFDFTDNLDFLDRCENTRQNFDIYFFTSSNLNFRAKNG